MSYRSSTVVSDGTRTNTTINVPAGAATGDHIIIGVITAAASAVSVSAPDGTWTVLGGGAIALPDYSGYQMRMYLWVKQFTASPPSSWTFSHTNVLSAGFAVAYSGQGYVLAANVNTGTGQTSSNTGVTTTADNSDAIWIERTWDGNTTTAPSGMTKNVDSSGFVIATQAISPAGATGSKSHTNGNSAGTGKPWAAVMLALQPTSGSSSYSGTAGLSGAGTLTATARPAISRNATLSGSGSLTASSTLPNETGRSTGTTAAGTPWTRVTLNIGGDTAVCYFPTGRSIGTPGPAVIYGHGSGDVESTMIDGSYYSNVATRDHILDQGWIAFAPYAGGDNFANSTSQAAYSNALTWVNNLWPITGLVHFGFSMGALTGITFAMLGTYSGWPVRGYVCVDLPWDVAWFWANGGAYASGLLTAAYGSYSATYDPATYSTSAYSGMRALCSWSPDDTVAVSSAGGPAMASYAGGVANITLVQTSGEHGSTSHFIPSTINSWLDEVLSTPGGATGTAALSGSGTLGATPRPAIPATAALTGTGTLGVTSAPNLPTTAALSGAGTLTATGTPRPATTAALSGSGSLTMTGTPRPVTTVVLAGSGTLSATATPSIGQVAALTGDGALTAGAGSNAAGTATLAGGGNLTTSGTPTVAATANLAGSGTLTATSSGNSTGTVTLAGAGALTPAAIPATSGAVALSGVGTLVTTAGTAYVASVAMGGSGTLAASGRPALTAGCALAGVGVLAAAGAPTLALLLAMSGSGVLAAYGGTAPVGAPVKGGRLILTTQSARLALTTQPGRMEIAT